MTLSELAQTLGVPPRQIRFLVAEGILPPASKTGRAADAYGAAHLARARRYLGLHRLGMKPGSIKVLMAFDEAIPVYQDGAVELRVAQDVQPETLDIEETLTKIRAALVAFAGKDSTK